MVHETQIEKRRCVVANKFALAKCVHGKPLSVNAQKVMAYLIAQIEQGESDFNTYEVSQKELEKLLGMSPYSNAGKRVLRKAVDELLGYIIAIPEEKREYITTLLSECWYWYNSGAASFRFSPGLKPYLLELKKYFTQYDLQAVLSFQSRYSFPLYQLFSSWLFPRATYISQTIELSELREILGTESKYKNFAHFKRYVLNPADRELAEYAHLKFTWAKKKSGNKVTHITFTINRQGELFDTRDTGKSRLREECEEWLKTQGVKLHGETADFFNGFSEEELRLGVAGMKTLLSGQNLKNPGGYIRRHFEEAIQEGVKQRTKRARESEEKRQEQHEKEENRRQRERQAELVKNATKEQVQQFIAEHPEGMNPATGEPIEAFFASWLQEKT